MFLSHGASCLIGCALQLHEALTHKRRDVAAGELVLLLRLHFQTGAGKVSGDSQPGLPAPMMATDLRMSFAQPGFQVAPSLKRQSRRPALMACGWIFMEISLCS